MNRTYAAIAAGVVASTIAFGVGTNYAKPPVVHTHTVIREHVRTVHSLPICGEVDDDCILPADMNNTDENGPYAGMTLIIHNGDVYTVDDGGAN